MGLFHCQYSINQRLIHLAGIFKTYQAVSTNKFCNFHLPKIKYMKKLSFLFIAPLFICAAQGQVRTPTLYVTGTVLSDEKMMVSVLGTKTIEGNVVTAELNGKKTEAKTDNKGHALLDFSAISAGLVSPTMAVIKSFDKNGNLIGTANTTVNQGNIRVPSRPVIEQLPKNIPNSEAVTIPGQNLGADAKLVCGDKPQETLSASDKEMTVFTNAKPGEQPAYVTTPNGVSESQTVNIYTLDFNLPKNSITPKENVQAQVHYESIPVGTKLVFTNKSPQTIKMTIPGAQNAANECIYTVADKNGSIPVNITGIIRGNFTIALDMDFKNQKKDSIPKVFYDEKPPVQPPVPVKPPDQAQPPAPPKPPTLAEALQIKDDIIKGLEELAKLLNGETIKDAKGKPVKVAGALEKLKTSIINEEAIKAAENSIIGKGFNFGNLERSDPSGNLEKAKKSIEKAIKQEQRAIDTKIGAYGILNDISKSIPGLIGKITGAKADEKNGKNDAAAEKEKAVKDALETMYGSLGDINNAIASAAGFSQDAIDLKNAAIVNVQDYIDPLKDKDQHKGDAKKIKDALGKTVTDLEKEKEALNGLSGEIDKLKEKCAGIKDNLDKLPK
jgi:hypothetical protein